MTTNELHHAKKTEEKSFWASSYVFILLPKSSLSLCTNESLRNNSDVTSFKILIHLKTWESTDKLTRCKILNLKAAHTR